MKFRPIKSPNQLPLW